MFRVGLGLLLLGLGIAHSANALELSDPTRPYRESAGPQAKTRPQPKLDLQSTLRADGRAYARIDDRLLKIGDAYEGYVLVDIGTDYVRLRGASRDKILRLNGEAIKRPIAPRETER